MSDVTVWVDTHGTSIAALRSAVPEKLLQLPVWLLWKSVPSGDKKPKKIPYYVTGKKRHGELDNPADRAQLVTFERAAAALTSDYAGLGVALGKVPDTEVQLAGIDLDRVAASDARVGRVLAAAETYSEVSVSGTGVHVLGTGCPRTVKEDAAGLEIYSKARYFTMSGRALTGPVLGSVTKAAALAEQLFLTPGGTKTPRAGRNNQLLDFVRDLPFDALEPGAKELARVKNQSFDEPLSEKEFAAVFGNGWKYHEAKRLRAGDVVAELQQKYALVYMGRDLLVMSKVEWDGQLPRMFAREAVKIEYRNRMVGKYNPVDLWIDSPERTLYRGLTFQPGVANTGEEFNLFIGWPREPREGDCSLMLAHLRDVICGRDEGLFQFVLQWLAQIFQQPRTIMGTLLSMGSPQGTGKGTLFRWLHALFGRYALQLTGADQLTGRFNDWMAGKLIVMGDEMLWSGDKKGINKFKAYVTEPRLLVEPKNLSTFMIDNYVRFLTSTNDERIAPVALDNRRWVTLRTAPDHIDDVPYWEALEREFQNGGAEALLHWLMQKVTIAVNLRRPPPSAADREQKQMNLDPVQEWWRWMLMKNDHALQDPLITVQFGDVVVTYQLFEFYSAYCRRHHRHVHESLDSLGSALRKYVALTRRKATAEERRRLDVPPDKDSARVYCLPELQEARRQFEAACGSGEMDWPGHNPDAPAAF